MTQDALDDFFVRSQFIQIRRDATPEAMPTIPLQAKFFDGRTDDSLGQFVEVHVGSGTVVKHDSGRRVSAGKADGVRVMTFQSAEGGYVGQILNSADENKDVNLEAQGKTLHLTVPTKSISTAIW